MKAFCATRLALAIGLAGVAYLSPAAAAAPVINEFSASTTGTDVEYVELFGDADTDYSSLTVVEIEGDGAAAGTIDGVIPMGLANAFGIWLASLAANSLENGSLTLLLVDGFVGSSGADLDADNDGILDSTPWSSIVDSVAVFDGDGGDQTYGVALGPNFDGISGFPPGGASRFPDGLDSDGVSDWVRNDFDLAGISGFAGSPDAGEALNTPGALNELIEPSTGGECGDPVAFIHQIQGSGAVFDPDFAGVQSVEGVISAVHPALGGFYVQEEPADQDADAATSEGIFVYLGGDPEVDLVAGDVVRVTGTVDEHETSGGASSQTQLAGSPALEVCGNTAVPAPVDLLFPVADLSELEAVEGMLVRLPQDMVISEFFNFDRFGEVVVALPPNGWYRLYTPTAVVEPGAPAVALADDYVRRRILIDDARSSQNPDPAIHPGNGDVFTLDNRFRGGDLITGIEGVIDQTFGEYRLQPTRYGAYSAVNHRPPAPDAVGGNTRVAAMNVLNYFLTLDQGPDVCGGGANLECRGADSTEELERQREKIVAALAGLNADVVGLTEMENTPGVEPAADLASRLNDAVGADTYAFVDTGVVGTDAIRVGILYRPDVVQPVNGFAVLDSSVDSRFIDDRNRPVIAQTFERNGQRFTIAVNHLKSKGSPCDDVGDPSLDDGQGNCNETRTQAAAALADWLAGDPTGAGSSSSLVIGDLNSYDKEDPIDVLESAGYSDLLAQFQGELAYSYVFDGQSGYLDYVMASHDLLPHVTGATAWHVNADEPDILDYDTSFKRDAQDQLFEANAFRSSDHDPVIVGLQLDWPTPSSKGDCKRGGWRTLYRPDGSPFRNQGSCIRFVLVGR